MGIKPALTSTNGPLRKAVVTALTELGYQHSVNSSGDAILSTICTTGPQPWLAEIALFEKSCAIAISVNLTIVFDPRLKPTESQELLSRLNAAVVFGCFFAPVGQDSFIYRTAANFPNGATPQQVSKFLGQLNFPLCLWRELCSKFPPKTNVNDRLQASLIRLDCHDGGVVSRQTRRALLRLVKSTDASDKFEPQPSSFSLMLV